MFDKKPPETLVINGVEYPIKTDFRAVLRCNSLLMDDAGDGSALEEALIFMFGCVPENVLEAVSKLSWFLRCGEEKKKNRPSNNLLGMNNEKPMDYEEDEILIWSAFRQVYQIDLRTVPYLHWWDFQAMLDELPDSVRLNKVIRYRTIDTKNKNLSKEERTIYGAMQRYYRIREKRSDMDEKLAEALRNGKDPAPYL